MLPKTLQAPNLHHLLLEGFACAACPIQSRLYPTAVDLVAFCLLIRLSSAYFQPNILLQWIFFMPQLESLNIQFAFPVPNRDVERQLTWAPITTHYIILPNLRFFCFRGVSAYLESLVCGITTPRLKILQIIFFEQLTFSVPCLAQFMNTSENLRFHDAVIGLEDKKIRVGMFAPRSTPHIPLL